MEKQPKEISWAKVEKLRKRTISTNRAVLSLEKNLRKRKMQGCELNEDEESSNQSIMIITR